MTQTADHTTGLPTNPAAAPPTTTGLPATLPISPPVAGSHRADAPSVPTHAATHAATTAAPTDPVASARAYAQARGWAFFDISHADIPDTTLRLLPSALARQHRAVPIQVEANRVFVAVTDPGDVALQQALQPLFAGYTLRLCYADPDALNTRIQQVYSARTEAAQVARRTDSDTSTARQGTEATDLGRVLSAGGSSNQQMFDLLVEQAIADGASDIHLEPTADSLEIRFRIDGHLRLAAPFPRERAEGLVNYIKIQSELPTDVSLVPDSGGLVFAPSGRAPVDLRVETTPTAWGQAAVLRIQDKVSRDLDALGFSPLNERRFRAALAQPHGVILAVGPTGSGKTTLLYSAIGEKVSDTTKIITLEDPVEFKAPRGLTQIEVNEETGLTFEVGLRSMVRQDPDVLLIGEIRDEVTAQAAVDASTTGHLVLSTVHTNDAAGVLTRLARMGIDPFLIASNLLCVVGQRLVPALCASCRVPYTADAAHLSATGLPDELAGRVLYEANAAGCSDCTDGVTGRLAIHEVLLMDEALEALVTDSAPIAQIRAAAKAAGMVTMREDGFGKVAEGRISVRDLNAATRRDMTSMV